MDLRTIFVRTGHHWTRHMAPRLLLGIGTLMSLILASGAGSHWR